MNREDIVSRINKNHQSFIDYLSNLSKEEFEFSNHGKWSAGQQLAHIVLCIEATLGVFNMDKSAIERHFGRSTRENRTYDALRNDYDKKTVGGGKAPNQFVPGMITIDQSCVLIKKLNLLIKDFGLQIIEFSEQELNVLLIPHPLLDDITLKEMLYNVAYHVEHHHFKTIENLRQ